MTSIFAYKFWQYISKVLYVKYEVATTTQISQTYYTIPGIDIIPPAYIRFEQPSVVQSKILFTLTPSNKSEKLVGYT